MQPELTALFTQITGKKPYGFQTQVAREVLEQERVILRAPTGSGKTWAALLPFLYAKENRTPWADRLIYAVPLRTLGKNLYSTIKKRLDDQFPGKYRVTMQTGDVPDDPLFEGDIILCTVDQLLSAYILHPYAVGPRRANVVAGALSGAYVVIDETHLLTPRESLATAVDMVRRYQGLMTALFMTATMPDTVMDEVARRCKAKTITVTEEQMESDPQSRQVKPERRIHRMTIPLSPEAVLSEHRTSSLVVCNTVDRAVRFYQTLKKMLGENKSDIPLFLLHSRFLPEDRARLERRITEQFGPDRTGRGIIISTQVLEAGVDISADVLHTELAPANAIVQRSGRVARYGGLGSIFVYDITEDGKRNYAPYFGVSIAANASSATNDINASSDEAEARRIMDATWDSLEKWDGKVIGFTQELAWVNEIHAAVEQRALRSRTERKVIDDVNAAMRSQSSHFLRDLVRNAASINLLVHPDPNTLDMRRQPPLFSLHPGVFRRIVRRVLRGEQDGAMWFMDFRENDEIIWMEIKNEKDLDGRYFFAVSPQLAAYHPEIGLTMESGTFQCKEKLDKPPVYERFRYRKELLSDHLQAVAGECEQQGKRNQAAVARWAELLCLRTDTIESFSWLGAAGHDAGKASLQWQTWARNYQFVLTGKVEEECLAHTDYDPENPRVKEAEKSKRKPSHAAEGAYYLFDRLLQPVADGLIPDDLPKAEIIARSVMTAIARHHGPHVKELNRQIEFCGMPDAVANWLSEQVKTMPVDTAILENIGLQSAWKSESSFDRNRFAKLLVDPKLNECGNNVLKELAWLFYLYLVRRLRMADWASMERAHPEKEVEKGDC
ncbi:crispr-associated helicase cas3, putative [Heliomicrobium modesticaldum Ice1]|uniref:Crispr-associated helicase cas3, putative n=1 Tax=Heliobacterium modesticaldum (strain ATCC 51547 / Ice1) TaxID=498761 RepID=B0TFM5_HELMI|nr:CRISPR-associated helicase Cas3' [Heliomicrobium modesticaldum]ABZ83124.1 crispr-associated helicase cas3, putative [Heliomicrobium modesticaldum Ice1]